MKIKYKIIYKNNKPSLLGEGLEFNRIDKDWNEIEKVIFWVKDIVNIYTFVINQPCSIIKRWEQKLTVNSKLDILNTDKTYWYIIKLQNGTEINLYLDRIEV